MSRVKVGHLTCLHSRSWMALVDTLQCAHMLGMVSWCFLGCPKCTGCNARRAATWQVQSLPPSTESGVSKAVLVQPAMPSRHRLQSRLGSGDMKPNGRDLLKVVDGSVLLNVAV
ncbi:TPA: hypothetical protein ACH3X2_006675 [Trebouxia sp. C0005]